MEEVNTFSVDRSRFTAFSPTSAARLNALSKKSELEILKSEDSPPLKATKEQPPVLLGNVVKEAEAEQKEKTSINISDFVPTGLTERQQLALLLNQTEEKVEEAETPRRSGRERMTTQPLSYGTTAAKPQPTKHSLKSPRGPKAAPSTPQIRTQVVKPKSSHPQGYSEWSLAKRKAWDLIESNPNAYYYRHLAPGELKKEGKWTKSEHRLFLKVLSSEGTKTNHWGMFGKEIPGRVGYQCRNYYHMLLSQGLLKDPDYTHEGKYSHKKVKSEIEEVRQSKIRKQARALLSGMGEDWREEEEEEAEIEEEEEEEMEFEEEKAEEEEVVELEEEIEVKEEREKEVEEEREKEEEEVQENGFSVSAENMDTNEPQSPESLLPREEVVKLLASQKTELEPISAPRKPNKQQFRMQSKALELHARRIEYEQFRRIAEVEKQAKKLQEREAQDVERARLRVEEQRRSLEFSRKRAQEAVNAEYEKSQERELKRARSWERKITAPSGIPQPQATERDISNSIRGDNELFIPHPHTTLNVWDAPSTEARSVALRALHVRFESEWLKVNQAFHNEISRELTLITKHKEFGFETAVNSISAEPSPIGLTTKGPQNTNVTNQTAVKRIHSIGDKFKEGVSSLLSLQRMEAHAVCAVHRAQLIRELQARGSVADAISNHDSLSGKVLSPASAKAVGVSKIPSVEDMVSDLDISFPYELELPSL